MAVRRGSRPERAVVTLGPGGGQMARVLREPWRQKPELGVLAPSGSLVVEEPRMGRRAGSLPAGGVGPL